MFVCAWLDLLTVCPHVPRVNCVIATKHQDRHDPDPQSTVHNFICSVSEKYKVSIFVIIDNR